MSRAAQIEEIQDDEFRARIVEKTNDEEEDWEDSEATSDSDEDDDMVFERGLVVPEETVWERLSALRDIVPPSTRQSISAKLSTLSSYGGVTALWGGRAAWVLTTTLLLWGLPYSLAVEDEMRVMQQERDFNAQQQGAQQMLGGQPAAPGAPAGGQQQGIRPPGF